MSDERIKSMVDDTYDESREDTLRAMVRESYSRKMLTSTILIWAYFLVFLALAIFSSIQFFRADEVKPQIMYAAIFVCSIQLIALVKSFGWAMLQMIRTNRIRKEMKSLEARIAELDETVKSR